MKVFLRVAVDVSADGQRRDVETVKEAVKQGVFELASGRTIPPRERPRQVRRPP
jgi:hypothetical protein